MNNKLLPQAFIDKVTGFIPNELSLEEFVDYCHRPLRKSIRVNTLKISVADFKQRMEKQQWILNPVPWCETGFWLQRPAEQEQSVPLGNTFEHMAGLFYIQEASSMMPPIALAEALTDAETVLDVAAAPGSKTTQIAALMDNEGTIIANEFSSTRLKGLHSNIQRCGIKNVSMTHFDGRIFGQYLPESFDAILLDTPCGGEGTVRKDPEAMHNWSQHAVEELSSLQKELIESAFKALKPSGRLIYSTCTLSPEENQHVCQHLINTYPDAVSIIPLDGLFEGAADCTTDEGYLHVWPQIYDSEGFFVACIEKTASVSAEPEKVKIGKFPFVPASKKTLAQLKDYLAGQFGFELPAHSLIYQRDKEFWWFPDHQNRFIGKVKCDRMGLKLADQFIKGKQSGFRITHEFAIVAGAQFTKNVYSMTIDQLKSFYQGKDISLAEATQQTGEVIVTFDSNVVGTGKWIKQKIKNSLPRELVKDSRLIF